MTIWSRVNPVEWLAALSHSAHVHPFAGIALGSYGLRNVGRVADAQIFHMEIPMTAATSVRVTRNLGMLLLAIWLIISGLVPLLKLSFDGLGMLLAVLAIAAGALILTGR